MTFEWLNEVKRRQNMIWDEVHGLSTKANTSKADEDKSFKATGQNEKGISEAGNSSADKEVRLSTSKVK